MFIVEDWQNGKMLGVTEKTILQIKFRITELEKEM